MLRYSSLAAALCLIAATAAPGFQRPVIKILLPKAIHEDGRPVLWPNTATIQVLGMISPPVPGGVRVRIYTVFEDGGLMQMAGTVARLEEEGTSFVELEAPGAGWTVGTMRVEITYLQMKQVKAHVDLTIIADAAARPQGVFHPPADSGIDVDLEMTRGKTVKVQADRLFRIRGQFLAKEFKSSLNGPSVMYQISQEPKDGAPRKRIGFESTLSLRQKGDEPRYEYECEVQAPSKAGTYGVRVARHGRAEELKREKPDFTLEVTEPEKKADE